MSHLQMIAFDADDTLWHNERLFSRAQARFTRLLSQYHEPEWVHQRLLETESRNIQHFGYGIKGFALSMIETAVELTEGRIAGSDVHTLVEMAKEMLNAEVELLEGVAQTVCELSSRYPLMIITKGDLLDQESKVARSGLAGYFKHIEIVSHKDCASYERLLHKYNLQAQHFLMVGNSVRSDILPVLELGGIAVHVPYGETWAHEPAEIPKGTASFYELPRLDLLPALVAQLN